jgi:hypothetical protein
VVFIPKAAENHVLPKKHQNIFRPRRAPPLFLSPRDSHHLVKTAAAARFHAPPSPRPSPVPLPPSSRTATGLLVPPPPVPPPAPRHLAALSAEAATPSAAIRRGHRSSGCFVRSRGSPLLHPPRPHAPGGSSRHAPRALLHQVSSALPAPDAVTEPPQK